ncbi:MAG: DUF7108 family protein [Halodesulfurarchaeum sp.]
MPEHQQRFPGNRLPDRVLEAALAATRAARRGTHADGAALRDRRDDLLARHGYRARVREDESGPVLVCYPDAWVEDGVIHPGAVESTAAAVERPLWREPDDDFETIAAHNRELAASVGDRHGWLHERNAAAFGTYMANHHAARVESATPTQVETFLAEYFPRNAWPSDEQQAAVETSLEYLFELVDPPFPLGGS